MLFANLSYPKRNIFPTSMFTRFLGLLLFLLSHSHPLSARMQGKPKQLAYAANVSQEAKKVEDHPIQVFLKMMASQLASQTANGQVDLTDLFKKKGTSIFLPGKLVAALKQVTYKAEAVSAKQGGTLKITFNAQTVPLVLKYCYSQQSQQKKSVAWTLTFDPHKESSITFNQVKMLTENLQISNKKKSQTIYHLAFSGDETLENLKIENNDNKYFFQQIFNYVLNKVLRPNSSASIIVDASGVIAKNVQLITFPNSQQFTGQDVRLNKECL